MSSEAVLGILAIIGVVVGIIAGVVQVLDYAQKQRQKRHESAARPPESPPSAPAPAAPAPPSTQRASLGNLPRPLTSFIGRERERDEVTRLLAGTRLLTLVGPGGTGKTRLGLEVGRAVQDRYADGVWLVELAALADEALVPQAVAAAFAVREQPDRPLLDSLSDALRPKALLLILDNCEHVLTACAVLATALLRAAPRVQILATSRQALGAAGETVWSVPTLDVPNPQVVDTTAEVLGFDAARLFVDRAAAALPSFAVTDRNARTVAEICHRLDGIPLALELAAARVRVLNVEQIAARLGDRFRLLTGGSRAEMPRQQTLRALIDWSHDLLDEPERALFRRLSVFGGSFTLEAVESVGQGDAVAEADVLGLLTSLLDKSLVAADAGTPDERRYRLLETIREYAREKLDGAGEAAAVRERHLGWYLALAEEAAPQLVGPGQVRWLARLELEHDNLRAALDWALAASPRPDAAVRLAGALWRFWHVHGYLSEGRRWLAQASEHAGDVAPAAHATALNGAGSLAAAQGDYGAAQVAFERSLALRRDAGDEHSVSASLNNLALVAQAQGDFERAALLYQESLETMRRLGDDQGIALALRNLGSMARRRGDYERAIALYEEAIALYRTLGNQQALAASLTNLGVVLQARGDRGRAAALHRESLALSREVGDRQSFAASLINLGDVAREDGDHDRAMALYRESLATMHELGDRMGMVASLEGLAATSCARADYADAARLYAAARARRETLGTPLPAAEREAHERDIACARTALGEASFTKLWEAGERLAIEEVLSQAPISASA